MQMILITLMKKAKKQYADFRRIWHFKYKVDLGIHTPMSFADKVKYYRLGFTEKDYYCFDLKTNDYHDYISYRERWRLEDINGRFAYILGEKMLNERLFGQYVNIPHTNCWVKNGACLDLETGEKTDILPILEEKERLIAKPTRSWGGGNGLHSLAYDGQKYSIDGKECSAEKLRASVCSWEEAIIVDFAVQAEYARRIFPDTTNTIRVITGQHKDGQIEILFSFHRFGSNRSKPVDNISSGGFVSLVDIETGTLGPAKTFFDPTRFYSIHPDTNERIEGVRIAHWDRIKSKMIQAHKCFPCYTFLAWDVVATESGDPYVLEINRGSDLGSQMLQPQRHEKLGQFMKEHGLLDNW